MKIDVTIATKNNQDTIGEVLKAIKLYIPYNRIILVDDSNDRTPEIARELGAHVYRVEGKLGIKRIMQAKLAETEFIASIDSDIVVYPNWFSELERHIRADGVASCSGQLDSDFKRVFNDYQEYMKFCSKFRMFFTRRSGVIGNVLIRRECLLLCEPYLQLVHAGEDTVIGKVMKKHGYRHVGSDASVGFHWHKDAFAHHRMAYQRAGESARMIRGRMKRLLIGGRFIAVQAAQLTCFTLMKRSFKGELLRYMYYMTMLYLSGLQDAAKLRCRTLDKLNLIENRLIKHAK